MVHPSRRPLPPSLCPVPLKLEPTNHRYKPEFPTDPVQLEQLAGTHRKENLDCANMDQLYAIAPFWRDNIESTVISGQITDELVRPGGTAR